MQPIVAVGDKVVEIHFGSPAEAVRFARCMADILSGWTEDQDCEKPSEETDGILAISDAIHAAVNKVCER